MASPKPACAHPQAPSGQYCCIAVSEALLTLLRWCLLALLYLFFFRVLQATWFASASTGRKVTSREEGVAAKRSKLSLRQRRSTASTIVLVEPLEVAGAAYPVTGSLTIGRAAGCEITLDDTFISQLHARVSMSESGVVVEDLGSTNGTYLNRRRVTAPVVVAPGDVIQVGSTVMELRS